MTTISDKALKVTPMSNLILQAAHEAKLFHKGQTRKYTGEPYIMHPMRVAGRVCLLTPSLSESVVAAAWLHDVLEDCVAPDNTPITEKDLLGMDFPVETVSLVVELTNPSKGSKLSREERKRMDRDHLAKASFWAKVVKLCDRIDNLRDMKAADADFKQVYADESILLQNVLYTSDVYIDSLCRELRNAVKDLV